MKKLAIVLAVVPIAAGCGATSHVTQQQSRPVEFSHCMRSNGVAKFPDPSSDGSIPKEGLQQLAVSLDQYMSAQRACRRYLPNGGQPPDQATIQHVRELSVEFSHCVRRHGIPNFPDPGSDGRIPDPATGGFDQGSPLFQAANTACARYRPPYMPSNAGYDRYERTHHG